jgi:hypothetical protein
LPDAGCDLARMVVYFGGVGLGSRSP